VKEGNHDQFEIYRRRDGDTCAHGDARPIRPGEECPAAGSRTATWISCEELQQTTPTEQEQETMRQEAEDRAEDQRLNAVREAFWHNTPEGHHDRELLHDLLVASGVAQEPTPEQIRAFFMALPADIIGAALLGVL
jgi:hypothetical protein